MKVKINKQEKESLDNKIVFFSSAIFLYALLLAFIQRMSAEAITVNGAIAFIQILRWSALAGAMVCAAWSAYKEKKSFFAYCAACLFVFLSTTVLLFCTRRSSASAYMINYAALVFMFVLGQLYYQLRIRGLMNKKVIKNLFIAVCVLGIIALAVVSIINTNKLFFM